MSDDLKSQLESMLGPTDQTHLLAGWDSLDGEQQASFLKQVQTVDFSLMSQLSAGTDKSTDWGALAARAESPAAIRLDGDKNEISSEAARAAGEAAIRAGKVAILVVAGGQGSRLGFDHPKGMYPLAPISNRTLFEIHVDRIVAASKRYDVSLPFFVMTSPATDAETRDYFAKHNNCGLPDGDLTIFCQGTMPAVDAATGQLLLAEPGKLFLSPDGHGGTLAALDRSGSIDAMKQRGIEYVFYFQVDNPMITLPDPEFIGYHILAKSEMTTQVVAKQDPQEKVGNVVLVDDRLQIIEYSDLPADQAGRRDANGNLVIWAGSIAVHVFDLAFLDRARADADSLPFHRASKKVPFINAEGQRVEPDSPNAIKFEKFIFDLLPSAQNGLVVEIDEATAFAPLKNASGAPKDTAETARAAMVAEHRSWLEQAGVKVADGVQVEINPKFAMDVDELKTKLDGVTEITSDKYIS